NPTSGQVIIRHLEDPLDLKQVEVINSLGQVLLKLNYSGNAGRNLQLDLSRMTSGLYNIRMTYTGKVISERIIKTK
ncbi:MAG: T9SS type A sorting domain-containing protein, partial [Flavitalea sp.]